MFKPFCCAALIAVVGLVETGHAQWIDYETMIRGAVGRQNEIVGGAVENTRGIVARNMNDPHVRQMYQAHLAQGGQMSLEQFSYWYGATAGGQNVGGYVENEKRIAANEAAAVKNYHNHVNGVWTDTIKERNEVQDRIARDRGDLLSGGTNYYNPNTGRNEYLPYNVPTGHTLPGYYGDPRTMTPGGTYQYGAPNGWNYEMQPVWNR